MYTETVELQALFVKLIVGFTAGWLAAAITQGSLMRPIGNGIVGLITNTIVGITGAFIGCYVLRDLGIGLPNDALGTIVMAIIGSVILLYVVWLVHE